MLLKGKDISKNEIIERFLKAVPHILNFAADKFSVDYDRKADVLYIGFERPQEATDSEMLEDGVILRYRKDKMVGLTILDASKREESPSMTRGGH
ncbi:MAG: DUF2283 domain-containing protein [Proteobacteria bacterium]|nr:DUF2283 domain-containing protein [Pseudomonadota bacterium]